MEALSIEVSGLFGQPWMMLGLWLLFLSEFPYVDMISSSVETASALLGRLLFPIPLSASPQLVSLFAAEYGFIHCLTTSNSLSKTSS
ncbi:unnamed protein product [Arabis nemorensis]|uniref:Uncharacterized protein n=1 Tax=Arabis nemorensis TaxID=586526 RepID=A0A565BGR3_9BRAS|nr:unnamed protein product [Arabis nemorensis]